MAIRLLPLMIMLLVLSGCVAPTRYTWVGYDDKLYTYYKNPAEADAFLEGMYTIIQGSEPAGKVPPGIYAEYGYALYERGRYDESVVWFVKERDKWPESRILMDKMIKLAGSRAKPRGTPSEVDQPALPETAKEKTP